MHQDELAAQYEANTARLDFLRARLVEARLQLASTGKLLADDVSYEETVTVGTRLFSELLQLPYGIHEIAQRQARARIEWLTVEVKERAGVVKQSELLMRHLDEEAIAAIQNINPKFKAKRWPIAPESCFQYGERVMHLRRERTALEASIKSARDGIQELLREAKEKWGGKPDDPRTWLDCIPAYANRIFKEITSEQLTMKTTSHPGA